MFRRVLLRPGPQLHSHARSWYSQQPSNAVVSPQATPPASVTLQASNRLSPWSTSQQPRPQPASEPRFEQTNMDLQPAPLSAIELINSESVRLVQGRRAVCDGGGGPLGHPKIFINLDKPGPKPCGYWQATTHSVSALKLTHHYDSGIRFEQDHSHHH